VFERYVYFLKAPCGYAGHSDAWHKAMYEAMLALERCEDSSKRTQMLSQMPVPWLMDLIDFGSRVLQKPKVVIAAIRARIHECQDLAVILAIVSTHPHNMGPDDEKEWSQIVLTASKGVSRAFLTRRDFASVTLDMLQNAVDMMEGGDWSNGEVFTLPLNFRNALTTGIVGQRGEHLSLKEVEQASGKLSVLVEFNQDFADGLIICGRRCMMFEVVEGDAHTNKHMHMPGEHAIDFVGESFKYHVPSEKIEACRSGQLEEHKLSLRFSFRMSKLHQQCLGLVRYFAGSTQIPQASASVQAAYAYFRKCGRPKLAGILMEAMSTCFVVVGSMYTGAGLGCSDMEALVSHPKLRTGHYEEIGVLGTVIDWAMLQKQRGGWAPGDEVRVKPDCKLLQMRGMDCVVKSVSTCGKSMLVEVQHMGCGEILEMESAQVHDPAETGLIRLLANIRTPCIPVEHLTKRLSLKQQAFAAHYACYKQLVEEIAGVRCGKVAVNDVAAERREPRLGYPVFECQDQSKCLADLVLQYAASAREPRGEMTAQDVGSLLARICVNGDLAFGQALIETLERIKQTLSCRMREQQALQPRCPVTVAPNQQQAMSIKNLCQQHAAAPLQQHAQATTSTSAITDESGSQPGIAAMSQQPAPAHVSVPQEHVVSHPQTQTPGHTGSQQRMPEQDSFARRAAVHSATLQQPECAVSHQRLGCPSEQAAHSHSSIEPCECALCSVKQHLENRAPTNTGTCFLDNDATLGARILKRPLQVESAREDLQDSLRSCGTPAHKRLRPASPDSKDDEA
jgi:hypothetical protein